jgi:hypothetical protein
MFTKAHARSALLLALLFRATGVCAQLAAGQLSEPPWRSKGAPVAPGIAPQVPQPPSPPLSLQALFDAISVDPGASCLDRAKLVKRVARWLQRDLIDARIRVEVRGDPVRKNYVAFSIDRGGGDRSERTIPDAPEDCDQLHSALALSIALAIDADSANARAAELGSGELPSDEVLLSKPEPSEPPYFRFAVGAFGHATAGVLTDTSAAGSARFELGFVRFLDFRLGALTTQRDGQTLRPAEVDGTFYVNLTLARLDTCAAQVVGESVRMLACVGAIAGALRTRGERFYPVQTQTRLWSGAVTGIEAQASLLTWLALAASVDLTVPFAKHRIQALDIHGQVAAERQLTSVGVLVGAGLVFRVF